MKGNWIALHVPDLEKILTDHPSYEGEATENYFFRLLQELMNLEDQIALEVMACLQVAQLQELNNIMLEAIINGERLH